LEISAGSTGSLLAQEQPKHFSNEYSFRIKENFDLILFIRLPPLHKYEYLFKFELSLPGVLD